MTALKTAPIKTVTQAECTAEPSAERVECGTCGKRFSGGVVVTAGKIEPGNTVDRALYCDHCDHIQLWEQAIDPFGRFDVIVSQPVYEKRHKQVAKFLELHPHARGVEQE